VTARAEVIPLRRPRPVAAVIPLRRPRLALNITRDALQALACGWDDNTDPRRVLALRALVHPKLTGGDLFRIWGDYRNILGVLERYEDGMADWHDFGPDWESAGDNIRGEAEYTVLDLIHGIGGNGGSAA
jgi:hypothetical protein